ncbi:MAG TPA: c-type cytochrome [Luteibacter sp.]|uniref:c-type cytochrome n=1 Tax=Luteibacter sp. TaxID=1886636 RepID=UPI002F41FD5F
MSGSPSKSDQNFVRQFSWLTAGLSLLALVLMVLAYNIYSNIPKDQDPAVAKRTEARIAPVGAVYAGDTGRAAMLAAQEAATKLAASQVAYGGSTDGKTIYESLCHSCHTAGVAGAPKLGDKGAWSARIAEGTAVLIKHAIEGYTGPDGNHMPPKGGNPALNDEQVTNTVKWMVDQAK